jgi:PAS domain S-box-containing protein
MLVGCCSPAASNEPPQTEASAPKAPLPPHDLHVPEEMTLEEHEPGTRAGEGSATFNVAAHVETFRLALEQAGDGIAMTDAAGCFVFMNQRHATMFGYEHEDTLLGQPWSVLYPVEEAERIVRVIFPLLDAPGKRWRGLAYGVSRQGKTVRQEVSASHATSARASTPMRSAESCGRSLIARSGCRRSAP